MTGFPRIAHPGPATAARWTAVPTRAEPVAIDLAAGIPLDRAVCEAVGWGASAWLTLEDAPVETLSYVIPAASDGNHAAWYSETRSLGRGRIARAGLFLGRNGAAPYLHCHGLWAEDEHEAMGHLLCDRTALATPAVAKGWIFPDAEFTRKPDPETQFELFIPRAIQPGPENGLLVRLRPNTEICATLAEICRTCGMDRARVHGIGSLVGARFADGRSLDSYATEFLVRDGYVEKARADLNIVIVGMDGTYRQGRLAQGTNGICVTAEIFLEVTT